MTCFIPWANTKTCVSQTNAVKNQKVWRGFGNNEGEGTGKVENKTRKYSWQWAKHAGLYSDLLQASKGECLSALATQQKGP